MRCQSLRSIRRLQLVLSGAADAIERLENELRARGIHTRSLTVSHAFHSAQMEPALAPLAELFGRVSLRSPSIPLISNLSGRLATTELTEPPTGVITREKRCSSPRVFGR